MATLAQKAKSTPKTRRRPRAAQRTWQRTPKSNQKERARRTGRVLQTSVASADSTQTAARAAKLQRKEGVRTSPAGKWPLQRKQRPTPLQISQQVSQQIQAAATWEWHVPISLFSADAGAHSQRHPCGRGQLRPQPGEAQGSEARCAPQRRGSSLSRTGEPSGRNAMLLEKPLLGWAGRGHGPTGCYHLDDHQLTAIHSSSRRGHCQQLHGEP